MAKPMHVRFETPKELAEKAYQVLAMVREKGKLKRGINEVTKAVERKQAKLVVIAEDIDPPEIAAHLPPLSDEKGVPYLYVPEKRRLGEVSGLNVGASAVAVIEAGEAAPQVEELIASAKQLKPK
ncbi:MAG: 50S ribosomal protein L7Ae [Candidatus Hadarchaeales archaeon]